MSRPKFGALAVLLSLKWLVVAMGLWTLTAAAQPDSDFAVLGSDGQYTIEGYLGPVGPVVIPSTIYGWTVTAIDDYAFNGFYSAPNVTSITIPDTVISIGYRSFWQCTTLTNVVVGNGAVGEFFGMTESAQHAANECRIAFRASTVAEVDRLAEVVRRSGAGNIEGPAHEAPGYYAVFFEDPSGSRGIRRSPAFRRRIFLRDFVGRLGDIHVSL
jgi:hypothetical protein